LSLEEEKNDLEEKNTFLYFTQEQLNTQIVEKEAIIGKLREQIEECEEQIEQLRKSLQEENKNVTEISEIYSKENQDSESHIKKLNEEKAKLLKEKFVLLAKQSTLSVENETLVNENLRLIGDNNELKIIVEDGSKEIVQVQQNLDDLKEELVVSEMINLFFLKNVKT